MGWARQRLPKRFSSLAFGGQATARNPCTCSQGAVTSNLQTSCWRGQCGQAAGRGTLQRQRWFSFHSSLNQEKHQCKLHMTRTSTGGKSDHRIAENKEFIFLIVFLIKADIDLLALRKQRLYILKSSLFFGASIHAMSGNKASHVSCTLGEWGQWITERCSFVLRHF